MSELAQPCETCILTRSSILKEPLLASVTEVFDGWVKKAERSGDRSDRISCEDRATDP